MKQLEELLVRWRDDPNGAYRGWFLWEERLKNFRSIRSGIRAVVEEIRLGTFGAAYRGSSLETVVSSIAEQRQIFKGADHAFLWKPKLRIPDIYEDVDNQKAFGSFLNVCLCCNSEQELLAAIRELDGRKIKGLGPAAANLLYFLHPTIAPPFNTAIVNGFNLLTDARVKLGRWDEYLALRNGILRVNSEYRNFLSNDLGAIAGLLFDLGKGRYPIPNKDKTATGAERWAADLERVREEARRSHGLSRAACDQGEQDHTTLQGWLRDLGRHLGYKVWIASNDRSRSFANGKLGDGCLDCLPDSIESLPGADSIRFIDVLWLESDGRQIAAAFEVEHTTSIYSGILRLHDLARGGAGASVKGLFLVAPDKRQEEVFSQLRRPAFRSSLDLNIRYLPYGAIKESKDLIARFGESLKALDAIAIKI
jgi:type II restriction enzyme